MSGLDAETHYQRGKASITAGIQTRNRSKAAEAFYRAYWHFQSAIKIGLPSEVLTDIAYLSAIHNLPDYREIAPPKAALAAMPVLIASGVGDNADSLPESIGDLSGV